MDQQTPSAIVRRRCPGRAQYTAEELKAAVLAKLTYSVGKNTVAASQRDWFLAVAFATRDIVVERWIDSTNAVYADDRKRVYYLSLEFLIGRMLFDAIDQSRHRRADDARRCRSSASTWRTCGAIESDAALGNGGLGRLAACFMDSMATLSIAAYGYGIRYDNGLFRQIIRDGWQQEIPEDWLTHGNPWEFERPEVNYAIGFGGWVEAVADGEEYVRHVWHPDETVEAVGYDTPIVGWRGRHVNTLRLWSARARRSAEARRVQRRRLHRRAFGHRARRGDLEGALSERRDAGRPGTAAAAGIFLRLRLAARSRPPPRQTVRRHPHAARPRRGSAQRHASVDRRRRADAHSRRHQPPRVGRGLGDHQDGLLLHQPHAAARGAGELAGAADGAAAAAPHADHLSHQRHPSRRRAQARPRRSRVCSPRSR